MAQKPYIIKNPRELAVACLCEVEKESLLVPEAMARIPYQMSEEDRNFAYKIVYDTFRYLPGLSRILAHYCKPKKLPPFIRMLLNASICQMVFTRSPDYAILDEANKLAMPRFRGLKPLVNGVLRNIVREKNPIWDSWDNTTWLLPEWLGELLVQQYGAARLEGWLETWREVGVVSYWSAAQQPFEEDTPSDALPQARRRSNPIGIEDMVKRRIYVQNETSQAVSEMVVRSQAATVLDLCAAPGGKSCYIAAFGQVERLVACDSAPERIARLVENRDRLGLNFEIACLAAGELDSDQVFDLVLVDAPCSGIGIIGRHPEIKFLKKSPADASLRDTQQAILDAAWDHVKPGGHLLYTVCSLDRDELGKPPQDAVMDSEHINAWLPESVPCTKENGVFSFSPGSAFDGFLGMLLHKPISS